jgi:hypothetical protein
MEKFVISPSSALLLYFYDYEGLYKLEVMNWLQPMCPQLQKVELLMDSKSRPNGYCLCRMACPVESGSLYEVSRARFRQKPVAVRLFANEAQVHHWLTAYSNSLFKKFPREVPSVQPLLFVFGFRGTGDGARSTLGDAVVDAFQLHVAREDIFVLTIASDEAMRALVVEFDGREIDGAALKLVPSWSHSASPCIGVKRAPQGFVEAVAEFGTPMAAVVSGGELFVELPSIQKAREAVACINGLYGQSMGLAARIIDPRRMHANPKG